METMRFGYVSTMPTMIITRSGDDLRYTCGNKMTIRKYIESNDLRESDILRWYIVGNEISFKSKIRSRYQIKGRSQIIKTTNPDETLIELDHLYLDHMKTDRYTDFIIECLNL